MNKPFWLQMISPDNLNPINFIFWPLMVFNAWKTLFNGTWPAWTRLGGSICLTIFAVFMEVVNSAIFVLSLSYWLIGCISWFIVGRFK